MLGTSFIDSSLYDIQFHDCLTQYLNFSGAKMNRILFKNSDIKEATFMENSIQNMEVENTKFPKTEFIKTSLKGIDFSSCDIESSKFDAFSLQGIIINPFQAPYLIRMLGVVVKG